MNLLGSRSVATNIIIKVAGAGLAFASQVVLARRLEPTAYGELVLFITACSLLGIVGRCGLDVSLVRLAALARERNDTTALRALTIESCVFAAVLSAAVCLPLWPLRHLIPLLSPLTPALLTGIVVSVVLMSIGSVLGAAARGQSHVLFAEFVESVFRPVVLTGVAVSVIGLGWLNGIAAGILAWILSQAAAALVVGFRAWGRGKVAWRERLRMRALGFPPKSAGAFVGIGLVSFAMFQLDTFLLGVYRPATEVAGYNMACNFVRLVIFVPMILAGQAQPLLAVSWEGLHRVRFFRIADSLLLRSTLAAALFMALLLVIGPRLLTLTHPAFSEAASALRLLAVGHVVNAASIVLTTTLYMAGEERAVMSSQVLGAVAVAALYPALIPPFGAAGAAGAAVVGMGIVCVMLTFRYRQLRTGSVA